jgi:Trypsin-co-occurring domain 1
MFLFVRIPILVDAWVRGKRLGGARGTRCLGERCPTIISREDANRPPSCRRLLLHGTITHHSKREVEMAGLVKIALDKKGKRHVVAEVDDAKPTKAMTGTRGSEIRQAGRSLEEGLDEVAEAIEAVRKAADSSKPKEVTLELFLKLTASAGVVLTGVSAEASIKLILKWAP